MDEQPEYGEDRKIDGDVRDGDSNDRHADEFSIEHRRRQHANVRRTRVEEIRRQYADQK